jgi:hypothetical protein
VAKFCREDFIKLYNTIGWARVKTIPAYNGDDVKTLRAGIARNPRQAIGISHQALGEESPSGDASMKCGRGRRALLSGGAFGVLCVVW